jgi:two-component system, cell cycle sensor histidine kinase and response regulator CckA
MATDTFNSKAKILIVEDELIVAQNIDNQLRKLGYDVPGTTGSAQEAISLAEKFKPDLVLMDIKLSGSMDGISAAEQIRGRFGIPVVYLTAFADKETLQRAKITDPSGYILKPFELRNLHSTIEIALHKNQLEKKLKESELRFRILAESSPVGIFQTGIDGDCVYVNKKWCEFAGMSPKQAVGGGWVSAVYPDDRDRVAKAWYNSARTGSLFQQEYRFQTPQGEITWLFGSAAPLITESGDKIGYIGTITDITQRKNLEEELLTGRKLESVGILAGGIAHDFNNLLSVILGTISLMKEDSNITEDQFMMLESTEKASVQASDLAQKLITFSKGGWLNRKKFPVSLLIGEVIDQNFTHVSPSPSFKIDIPPGLLDVDGDKTQLKQVFLNLVLNAVEAGKETDQISITAGNIDNTKGNINTALKPGRYVRITVADKGMGIPREHLDKIFDPYFTTKEKGSKKGLGLGMTICYSVVKKHGGFIAVKSEECCGTTVDVYLPAAQEETPASVAIKDAKPAIKGRVMILDDEDIVLDVTRKMLERLGYQVEHAETGEQALDIFKQSAALGKRFDIILLDLVNKKGMGGKDTLKKIIETDPYAKVVALSGYSEPSDIVNLKAAGFTDALIKPFKLSDLKGLLEQLHTSPPGR